jgi:hypothetical protein
MKKNIFKFVNVSLAIVAMMTLSRISKASVDCDVCETELSGCTLGCLNNCTAQGHSDPGFNVQNCDNVCTNFCLDQYDACIATCGGS